MNLTYFNDYTFTDSIPIGTRPEIISLKFLKYLSNNIIDKSNTEYLTYYLKKNIGQTIYKYDFRFPKIYNDETLTIDTKEDLEYIRNIFKRLRNEPLLDLKELIHFINQNNLIKKTVNSSAARPVLELGSFDVFKSNYEDS